MSALQLESIPYKIHVKRKGKVGLQACHGYQVEPKLLLQAAPQGFHSHLQRHKKKKNQSIMLRDDPNNQGWIPCANFQ